MVRHLFFPLLRAGVSKFATNVIIFTFSAVLHELLISVSPPPPTASNPTNPINQPGACCAADSM